jgi:hypothetical protein
VASRSVLFPPAPDPAFDRDPATFVAAQADALAASVRKGWRAARG